MGGGFRAFGRRMGGVGGILQASKPSEAVVAALQKDAGSYRWVAAVVSANQAAGYQLASDRPVMAIGGFNGTDPAPTLEEFKSLVAAGKIHWFITGRGGFGTGPFGGGETSPASAITSWVTMTFPSTTIDGTTLYDLTPTQ
jgi:hypothetical protein